MSISPSDLAKSVRAYLRKAADPASISCKVRVPSHTRPRSLTLPSPRHPANEYPRSSVFVLPFIRRMSNLSHRSPGFPHQPSNWSNLFLSSLMLDRDLSRGGCTTLKYNR